VDSEVSRFKVEMHWKKSVSTSFVSDSGNSGYQSSDKQGLTVLTDTSLPCLLSAVFKSLF